MNGAVRTRQRMLAVVLPITAALYIAADGANPGRNSRRDKAGAFRVGREQNPKERP